MIGHNFASSGQDHLFIFYRAQNFLPIIDAHG